MKRYALGPIEPALTPAGAKTIIPLPKQWPQKLAFVLTTCGLNNHAPQYARQPVGAGIGHPAAEL